jgi:transposase-like protein
LQPARLPKPAESNTSRPRNNTAYLALGVAAGGPKDILGLCIKTSEGVKFWSRS